MDSKLDDKIVTAKFRNATVFRCSLHIVDKNITNRLKGFLHHRNMMDHVRKNILYAKTIEDVNKGIKTFETMYPTAFLKISDQLNSASTWALAYIMTSFTMNKHTAAMAEVSNSSMRRTMGRVLGNEHLLSSQHERVTQWGQEDALLAAKAATRYASSLMS